MTFNSRVFVTLERHMITSTENGMVYIGTFGFETIADSLERMHLTYRYRCCSISSQLGVAFQDCKG